MKAQDEIQQSQKWFRQILTQFPLQVIALKMSFLWPYQGKYTQIMGKLFTHLHISAQLIGMLLKIFEGVKRADGENRMLEGSCQAIICFNILFCYDYVAFNFEKLTTCLTIMARIFQDTDTYGQKVIIRSVTKFLTINSIVTIGLVILCLSGGAAQVIIPKVLSLTGNHTYKKSLPIFWDFYIDENEFFYPLCAIQFIILFSLGLIISSLNMFQFSYIGFIIGEFHQLQNYLKEMDDEYLCMLFENKQKAHRFLIEKLKRVIRHHIDCIGVFEHLYYLTSPVMFMTILGASSNIILSGTTMIVFMDTNLALVAEMLIVYGTSLLTMIMTCFPSQLLSNACHEMFNKIYCIKWYTYPPKARLMAVLLLLRLNKTLVLKAGSIIELNFETCSDVIKRTFSFTAAFRSFYTSSYT